EMNKAKTGVRLEGVDAVNPLTGKKIPIYIADYVMITYGTGAIMAVPGHDDRDYEFARQYGLPIIEVIAGGNLAERAFTDVETGILVNSGILDGFDVAAAQKKIIAYLEQAGIGKAATQYKMKDWAFNRQRYWGEPIPIVYCDDCGVVPVPFEDLPIRLPIVDRFEPTDTGESPLANIPSFVNCTCPKCGKPARRETDTMPQWAGSSWYFLRYMDPRNANAFASPELLRYWDRIDWYNGGMEHVTRHLIYSRFWNQFLFDCGLVPNAEPYRKRTAQGLILGADGEKMSKSRGNVVNPIDIIEEYGADTLRLYILFISDYELPTPWNDSGVKGCRRFLDKLWRFQEKTQPGSKYSPALENSIHRTIKGVGEDIEAMKFNTAIAKMMILANEATALETLTKKDLETMILLVYPFAPHIASEMWERQENADLLVTHPWPTYDESKLIEETVEIVVNVNGKVRDRLTVPVDASDEWLREQALALPRIVDLIGDQPVKKIIVVPKKLVNIVI
ncbi:MAG: class I tRNA ligase family protein, partial [bacterium]